MKKIKNKQQDQHTDDDMKKGTQKRSWSDIVQDEKWDEFLAWCREQENGPHE